MIDGGHDVVDFGVPYGMEQLLDGHRSVIGRRLLEHCGGCRGGGCCRVGRWCGGGGDGCRLAATGPGHGGRDRSRMLWPLPGVVQRERLDEVIVDGRAMRTRHFAAVVAVEVQPLVRHHHRFLATVTL